MRIRNEKSEAIIIKKNYMCACMCVRSTLCKQAVLQKKRGREKNMQTKRGRRRSDARICSNMDKIENELFIYSCIIGERRNESFIFSLNNMIHVNKNYKRDHHSFPHFFLYSLSLLKILLYFYYSIIPYVEKV